MDGFGGPNLEQHGVNGLSCVLVQDMNHSTGSIPEKQLIHSNMTEKSRLYVNTHNKQANFIYHRQTLIVRLFKYLKENKIAFELIPTLLRGNIHIARCQKSKYLPLTLINIKSKRREMQYLIIIDDDLGDKFAPSLVH